MLYFYWVLVMVFHGARRLFVVRPACKTKYIASPYKLHKGAVGGIPVLKANIWDVTI